MNKGRFFDEMDIQAVESKLNDVTVTAIPMSASKQQQQQQQQYGHHHSNSNTSAHYQSSKSQKNQSSQFLTYQQNQLIQSAIQLVQQQQLQQQQQQQQQQHQQQRQRQQQQLQQQQEREKEREALDNARLVSATPPASQLYSSYSQGSNGLGLSQSAAQSSGLSKYAQLLAVIEEMGRDIRPTYAMGRGDRLKRLIIQAKVLVRECLLETERSARQ